MAITDLDEYWCGVLQRGRTTLQSLIAGVLVRAALPSFSCTSTYHVCIDKPGCSRSIEDARVGECTSSEYWTP